MTFLVVFICCAAELTYVSFEPFRGGRWILSWHAWLADTIGLRRWLGGGCLLVTLALPCLLLAIIFNSLIAGSTMLSLFGGVAVLLFCFGSRDLAREIEAYTSYYLDDGQEVPPPEKSNFLNDVDATDGGPDGPRLRAVVIEANDSLFAPAFWFCVLGPVGALLFRISSTLSHARGAADAVFTRRLYDILIWLPARLLGLGLGLAGTLPPVLSVLHRRHYGLSQSAALIGDAALAALDRQGLAGGGGDQQVTLIGNMFGLVKRGFVVWLVVLALLAAAGLV